MGEIKIIEYNKSYAKELARMWNLSAESWGGESVIQTETYVISNEEGSGNIKTYLALADDEVVGYCSFSNYKQDVGASYIPLLNVRPDYLGQKVGKKLILRVVDEAIKAEWPRLDLYTWQGNDKAVPLYKKCGFFWEKRDDSTHLMNFIPYVMKTEAVSEYFEILDWYEDSVREIKIDCDGRFEGEFEYYDYVWHKDNMNLSMEFERRGRGLTAIETNDYLIRARVAEQKLVIGMEYSIEYELVNKSGKPLEIRILGKNEKLINLDMDQEMSVTVEEVIKGDFHINETKDIQDQWKSHPCVSADIYINGKKAEFRVGINPKQPLEVKLITPQKTTSIGDNTLYLNIENGFNEEISLNGNINENPLLKIKTDHIKETIGALSKLSIPIDVEVLNHGFYEEDISFDITCRDKTIKYTTKLQTILRSYTNKFHGEDNEYYILVNGGVTLTYLIKRNFAWLNHVNNNESNGLGSFMPQLGKPYFEEFAGKKPDERSFVSTEESEMLVLSFNSEKMPGLVMKWHFELFNEGMMKSYVTILNNRISELKEMYIKQKALFFFSDGYLPINDSVVHVRNDDGFLPYIWNPENLTENWLFSKSSAFGKTLLWDEGFKLSHSHEMVNFESESYNVKPGESAISKSYALSINTFSDYREVRDYLDCSDDKRNIIDDFETRFNENNPFVDHNEVSVAISEYKEVKPECCVKVDSKYGKASICGNDYGEHAELAEHPEHADGAVDYVDIDFVDKKALININYMDKAKMDIISLEIDSPNKWIRRERALFFKSDYEIKHKEYSESGKLVLEISNEDISIKASPEFGPGIFSMNVKGMEWLDHSFPEPSIKAWWNFWTGGLALVPHNLSNASMVEEPKKAEFVSIKDNKNNLWSGIKTTLAVEHNIELKGTIIEEYFLMLPGVSVMARFAKVTQNLNKYEDDFVLHSFGFYNRGNGLKDCWLILDGKDKFEKYYFGESEFELHVNKYMLYGRQGSEVLMTRLVNDQRLNEVENTNGVSIDYDEFRVSIASGESKTIEPNFYVFAKEGLNDLVLEDLYGLRFDI